MSTPKTAPASLSVLPAVARYGNIIFRDGPVHDGDVFSRKHPKMSQQNRAKLFAPFAALVDFDERIHKKEIVYVSKHELDADEEWEQNHKLFRLYCLTANSKLARANMVRVSIEYFVVCTDEENDAYLVKGQYKTITGMVLKVDPHEQTITVRSGANTEIIPFSDIYRIFKPTG